MKKKYLKNVIALLVIILVVSIAAAWSIADNRSNNFIHPNAKIYLYGESHGLKQFYNAEYEAWENYYNNEGMRVLFMELPYYTAQYLNMWMAASDDSILNDIYTDIDGTASHTPAYLEFLKKIKANCPETKFYGTDIGHQYSTTGKRYLNYICNIDKYDVNEVERVQECIRQGEEWANSSVNGEANWALREKYMISNFTSAYYRCGSEKIMGIYGSYHIDQSNTAVMANALCNEYPGMVDSIYVVTDILYPKNYRLGFSFAGLVFVLMLYIPRLISLAFMPKEFEAVRKQESIIMKIIKNIGRTGITVSAVIFLDFEPRIIVADGGIQFPGIITFQFLSTVSMVLYIFFWLHYFVSKRTMADLYYDFAGIPFASAVLPVMGALFLGFYGDNLIMIGSALCLGISHVSMLIVNYIRVKEGRIPVIENTKEKIEKIKAEKKEEAEHKAIEKKEKEEKLAAEKKAQEEKLAAEKKAREEKLAAEKREREEKLAAEKKEREELEAQKAAEKKEREEKLAAEKKEREEKLAAEKKEKEELEAQKAAEKKALAEKKANLKKRRAEQKAFEKQGWVNTTADSNGKTPDNAI